MLASPLGWASCPATGVTAETDPPAAETDALGVAEAAAGGVAGFDGWPDELDDPPPLPQPASTPAAAATARAPIAMDLERVIGRCLRWSSQRSGWSTRRPRRCGRRRPG